MSIEKKHIVYTAADIKKYLSGGMSNTDMYAIEKAALDDPFLAEAIEGYEGLEQKDWSRELAGLKQKLLQVENAPVVPLYQSSFTKWWKTAAAVLVIGCSVGVAFLFTNKKIDTSIAVTESRDLFDSITTAKKDTLDIAAVTASPAVTSQHINAASSTMKNADSFKQPLLANLGTAENRNDDFVYRPPIPAAEDYNNASGRTETDESQKSTESVATVNKGIFLNKQLNEANALNSDKDVRNQNNNAADNAKLQNNPSNNYFNAQVVTADDKPVAFANVTVPKNNKPVYTDAQGNFKLPAADSTLNVVVTSAGYEPKKYTLQNSAAQNKIVLQQNELATREISIGKKRATAKIEMKRVADSTLAAEADDAEPSGGWAEYNNYLHNNLVFPNSAIEKNIHGEVEVFIKLKSNGDISKVKVGKPLCPECDAEAIRLVKEGPKWEVKKNKASKAKVKIKF